MYFNFNKNNTKSKNNYNNIYYCDIITNGMHK